MNPNVLLKNIEKYPKTSMSLIQFEDLIDFLEGLARCSRMFQLLCYQDFGTQRTHLCGKMKLQIWLEDSSCLNRNTQNTQTYHRPELPPSITSENLMVGKDDLFFWMVAFQLLLLNLGGYIDMYIYIYRYDKT